MHIQQLNFTKGDSKIPGFIVMLCFGLLSLLRWSFTGELFFAILSIRDITAAFLIAKRNPSEHIASTKDKLLAYSSSVVGLCFLAPSEQPLFSQAVLAANILAIFGFTIVCFATLDLGKCMGVAPAKRGERVVDGIYGYLKHPMYVGYAIAQFGFVLTNPLNLSLYVLSIILFKSRIKKEEALFRTLNG